MDEILEKVALLSDAWKARSGRDDEEWGRLMAKQSELEAELRCRMPRNIGANVPVVLTWDVDASKLVLRVVW